MRNRRFGIRAAVLAVLAGGGVAQADPAGAPAGTSLEDVVVTATKRAEKLKDVAMAVTAVTGDDLLRRQESSFVDFASQVPGLSLQAEDAGTIRLIIRGANVGSVGSTVATVVDDIPFSMSSAQADGAYFSANVDTYDLQRVEVLRGPQGTLYGATAEGGLIKYVTNPPNLTKYEADVLVGGETVDGGSSIGKVRGLVNVPFWDNKAAIRISGVREGVAGWIDNPLVGEKNVNKGDKYSLRGSLLVRPNDSLKVRFTYFDQDLEVGGDQTTQVVGAALTPTTPPANQFDQIDGYNNPHLWPHKIANHQTFYALNIEANLPGATLMSSTSYGKISNRFTSELTSTNVAPGVSYGDLFAALVYGQPTVIAGRQSEFVHKFNQELRLSSNPGSTLGGHGFDWQGGLYFTREAVDLNQFYDARDAANTQTVLQPVLGGADIPADYKEWAVFADFTYHFTSVFDVEFGGRQAGTKQHSQVALACCVLYGPDTTYPVFNSSETSHTWSLAPRWHVTPDVLLYARYSTGYRPGGPNLPTPSLPNPPNLLPDSTRNYEAGFRGDFLNKKISVDVSYFLIDWKDVQILSIVNTPTGPVGINGNSGSARSHGVEFNFTVRPVTGLSLQLLGAYTDAKLTSDAPGLGAFDGDKLPYVPDVNATFNVDYTWRAFAGFDANVGASWTYTGSAYTGFSPSAPVEPHVKLPTYNTLKIQAGLDNGHWNGQVYAANLTNAKGITDYANNGGVNQTGGASFIQPRTIGVQLGYKF